MSPFIAQSADRLRGASSSQRRREETESAVQPSDLNARRKSPSTDFTTKGIEYA